MTASDPTDAATTPSRRPRLLGRRPALAVLGLAAAFAAGWAAITGAPADAAAPFSGEVVDGVLTVRGSDGDDVIVVRDQLGNPSVVEIDYSDDGSADLSFDRSTFTTLRVVGLKGNDVVQHLDSGASSTDPFATVLDGGPGNDVITGTLVPETLVGGGGNDLVDGRGGDDILRLGGGADEARWAPGGGSDFVEGEGGTDTLTVDGDAQAESFTLSRYGPRLRVTRDLGPDALDVSSVEAVAVNPLDGTDTVTLSSLAGTATDQVQVDLGAAGAADGLADTVVVNGTENADRVSLVDRSPAVAVTGLSVESSVTGADPALDRLLLNTLGGGDSIGATPHLGALLGVSIDAGGDVDDTVIGWGTAGDDTLGAVANGTLVALTDDSHYVSVTGAHTVRVNGLAGNDLCYGVGNLAALIPQYVVDGGVGDDVVNGGNGADLVMGGPGNDLVDGNQGDDIALLGTGNDTVQWDPGDGSDTVEGEDGTDRFLFWGSSGNEQLALSANGTRLRFTRDIGSIVVDLDGVEHPVLATRAGTDTVTVADLTGTAARQVDVDLQAFGGGGDTQADLVNVHATSGADSLRVTNEGSAATVRGVAVPTSVTGGEPGVDDLVVDGREGADSLTADPTAGGLIDVVLDGGLDVDAAFFDGTGGDDTLTATANGLTTAVSNQAGYFSVVAESLRINGKGGNDVLACTGNLAALTAVTLEGGGGSDQILGSNGADLLLGGGGHDLIDGNQGADVALLGTGNDTAQWDPGDGLDVIEGEGGTDTLAFNGSATNEIIDLAANGTRVRLTRNVGTISLDLGGIETVAVNAFGGSDVVTVNDLAGTATKAVEVDLAVFGAADAQPDQVTVFGTSGVDTIGVTGSGMDALVTGLATTVEVHSGEYVNDALRLETLAGDDLVDFGGLPYGGIQLWIDGLFVM